MELLEDVLCIIPARYASTRFPGKPLVPLLGTPMVIWVARACELALGNDNVIIATDDFRVHEAAHKYGFRSQDSSPSALTGTDRVAEVAKRFGATTIVNVQGDEPLVSPADIREIALVHQNQPDFVVNGYAPLGIEEDPQSSTIPKVVFDELESLLYISRRDIPGSKSDLVNHDDKTYFKQVCIYAYSQNHLAAFCSRKRKSYLEAREDIEILRFLEMGQKVRMVRTQQISLAVDTPEDVVPAEKALRAGGH